MQDNPKAALSGGLGGVLVVAAVLVVLGATPLTLLPLVVAGVFLFGLLVREIRA